MHKILKCIHNSRNWVKYFFVAFGPLTMRLFIIGMSLSEPYIHCKEKGFSITYSFGHLPIAVKLFTSGLLFVGIYITE